MSLEDNPNLTLKLKSLPVSPGVYFHKNKEGEVIYVGKAAVLKNRVRQYFHNTKKDIKTEALVKEIYDTDWIVVDTEMDALFLESEMIKRYKPKWNILLRDDKTVSYVRISMEDPVPYISFTRIPLDDGATYVGPFYSKTAIEKSLRLLRKIFPYYVKPYDGKHNLDSDLGLAPGIESKKTTPRAYRYNLKKLIRVLSGERSDLLKDLEKEMYRESEKGNYESAASLRNEIYGLKELQKKIVFSDKEFLDISSDHALTELQTILGLDKPPVRIEGYDISHQSGTDVVASMVCFVNGAPSRENYRKFKLRTQKNDDPASMREVITRRLRHTEWPYPDLIILDGGLAQLHAVEDLLEPLGIPVIGKEKSGDHTKSLRTHDLIYKKPKNPNLTTKNPNESASKNISKNPNTPPNKIKDSDYTRLPAREEDFARLITRIDDEAHRFAITYHTYLSRKRLLK